MVDEYIDLGETKKESEKNAEEMIEDLNKQEVTSKPIQRASHTSESPIRVKGEENPKKSNDYDKDLKKKVDEVKRLYEQRDMDKEDYERKKKIFEEKRKKLIKDLEVLEGKINVEKERIDRLIEYMEKEKKDAQKDT